MQQKKKRSQSVEKDTSYNFSTKVLTFSKEKPRQMYFYAASIDFRLTKLGSGRLFPWLQSANVKICPRMTVVPPPPKL